jgi:thiamine biosynthesis protein ThiI
MRGLLLLSAGIDSPVAGYVCLKQGVQLIALHLVNSPAGSDTTIRLSQQLLGQLSSLSGSHIPLYAVQNQANEQLIWDNTDRRFQCIICKRLMYRIAENLAQAYACDFIITGENLGQVASQTLDNLTVLNEAIAMPVIRPILCNDKTDTIKLAEKIGTYALSITHSVNKCPFLPSNPATKAHLADVQYQESKLDLPAIAKVAADSAALIQFQKAY